MFIRLGYDYFLHKKIYIHKNKKLLIFNKIKIIYIIIKLFPLITWQDEPKSRVSKRINRTCFSPTY